MHGELSLFPLAPLPFMRTTVDLYIYLFYQKSNANTASIYTKGNHQQNEGLNGFFLFRSFPAHWFIYLYFLHVLRDD